MGPHRDRLRVVAAVLLVAAAVLLVVGTSLERSQAASETRQAAGVGRSRGEAGDHNEAAEQTTTSHSQTTEQANSTGNKEATEPAQGEHNQTAEQAGSSHNEAAEHAASGEELFGIDLEGVQLTVAAAVVSLLLAGLLATVAGRQVLLAVVIFALLFVALDLRESMHQASEAHAGLLAIALLAAVAHLGVAGLAGVRLRTPRHTAVGPSASTSRRRFS
jgi:hypothetical protein